MPSLSVLVFSATLLALTVATPTNQPGPAVLQANSTVPQGFQKLRSSHNSTLYSVQVDLDDTSYTSAPLLLHLRGSHYQIGYDYAALLHQETAETLDTFYKSVFPKRVDQTLLSDFVDLCWNKYLSPHVPQTFLDELEGMQAFHAEHNTNVSTPSDIVARRFYTLANLPADAVNIVSMLEEEVERGWPVWLKTAVNDIIRILEHLVHSCDSYGVWGSRTQSGLLFASRNLDYNSNTGINKFKLVTMYSIEDAKGNKPVGGTYATMGFAFGLGALAGMNSQGVSTSEMNLDNSRVGFDGTPFPLRLRMILEESHDLSSAMHVWNSTNNTNSFNFLISSAADAAAGQDGALALETILGYTGVFGANSPVEAAATYPCNGDPTCKKWTNKTGDVRIGFPLQDAVWRTNHGMNPTVMATQEPLFNNTIFRYNLMHDIFAGLEASNQLIDDTMAINIVATLGIKGPNYLTCDQKFDGDNVLSIAYAPGNRSDGGIGHFFVAWESNSGANWRPAACSTFLRFDLADWV